MENTFREPDDAAKARMTVGSINALLETLNEQRAKKVEEIDKEIEYYKQLLWKKKNA